MLLVTLLVGSACFGGGDGADGEDPGTPVDSSAVAVSAVPSDSATSDTVGTATPPTASASTGTAPTDGIASDSLSPVPAQDQLSGIEARLDRLIAEQEEMRARMDSALASGALSAGRADGQRELGPGGEVLGEASEQVQNFGRGVAWSIVVLIVFSLSIRALVWMLDTLAERNASRRLFYKRLVPIVRIVLWIFAAYLIVRVIFQVDAQGIVAAAAAVGVAVGFAAQDLLKNLFGGLILVFDQPFQSGDKISVGGTYGEVVSIGLRSTRIVTPDDNLVSVPNSQVVDQQVANANAGELNCQVVTDLYLPGWVDEAQAKTIAFQAAASSKYVYLKKPIVVLVSDVFKETFLTRIRVKAYVLDPRLEFMFQSDVTERARAGFRDAGLLRAEHMRLGLYRRSAAMDENVAAERRDADVR